MKVSGTNGNQVQIRHHEEAGHRTDEVSREYPNLWPEYAKQSLDDVDPDRDYYIRKR